ncbi:MAG TPA: hypothetical protein VFD20_06620, partial [Demequina sp.]|nr:hypothetical protein [Demequina sp.]
MTDVVVETLRLRGAHAARLARVAARSLPAALDRALADIADGHVDEIRVTLDIDPEGLDDEAVAALWADAVRTQLLELTGRRRAQVAGTQDSTADSAHGQRASADPGEAVRAAKTWLAGTEPRGPMPIAALTLTRPDIAAAVAATEGAEALAALVWELASAITDGARRVRQGLRTDHMDDVGPLAPPQTLDDAATAPPPERAPAGEIPTRERVTLTGKASRPSPASVDGDATAFATVEAFADLAVADAAALDLTTVTRAAGLALLYPWLADLCR